MSNEIRVSDDDGIRWIELCRPESRNGLTASINRRLINLVDEVRDRDELRVIVMAGAGGSFCSGLDLKDTLNRGPLDPEQARIDLGDAFQGLIRALQRA